MTTARSDSSAASSGFSARRRHSRCGVTGYVELLVRDLFNERDTWTRPGRVPRWYVWWRLWGVQNGTCAACPGPPQVIDHRHADGLVRGLLCYECNLGEALCASMLDLYQHSGQCWYKRYWDSPPGAQFGWYWPDPKRHGGIQWFLPHPPAWAADRTPPTATWLLRRDVQLR